MPDENISLAWVEAAADLGIRVLAPFQVTTDEGNIFIFEAYIAEFGSPQGTVVGNIDNRIPGVRQNNGFFAADLGPSYRIYARQLFLDTLNDWGWFGDEGKEPPWYTGQPWS
jgi:hypothetical protein